MAAYLRPHCIYWVTSTISGNGTTVCGIYSGRRNSHDPELQPSPGNSAGEVGGLKVDVHTDLGSHHRQRQHAPRRQRHEIWNGGTAVTADVLQRLQPRRPDLRCPSTASPRRQRDFDASDAGVPLTAILDTTLADNAAAARR